MRGYVAGKRFNVLSRDAGFRSRPGGRFGNAVLVPENIGSEFGPAGRTAAEEGFVGKLLLNQHVEEPEHHGAVGAGPDGNPLAPDFLSGPGTNGVDGNRADARAVLKASEDLRCLMERRRPVDVVRDERIASREDDPFRMFENRVPARGARVLHAERVGENGADRGRGIAVPGLNVAAHEVEKPLKERNRIVDAPRRLPAVGAAPYGARPEILVGASNCIGREVERLLPAHRNVGIISAGRAALCSLFEKALVRA